MSNPSFHETTHGVSWQVWEHILRTGAFAQARRRVLRQLFESLVYENIAPHEAVVAGGETRFTLRGADEQGRGVAYVALGRRRTSFGRVRLTAAVQRVAESGAEEAQSPARLLLETRSGHGASSEKLLQMIAELEQTELKDAQALAHAARAPRLADSYEELETAAGGGHPYHPSYKSRVGFDLSDNMAYGPEFAPSIAPIWIAADVRCTPRAAVSGLTPDQLLRSEIGRDTWAEWSARLRDASAELDSHVLLPVHPWQWRHQILPLMYDDIRTGRLIPLGPARDSYRPQQSIRTLANVSDVNRSALKLSLSILNTSTSRILAPHTVLNAPLISEWLDSLAQRDPFLREGPRPILLREIMGAAYDPPQPDLLNPRSYGALSCIWRESVHRFLEPGERAVPWAALTALDADGRPLIHGWLNPLPRAWLERLLEVSVVPILHFLAAHGIGLESHAQNMLLVHRDGTPTRVVFKDFHDGVRFAPQHLAQPQRLPALHPTPARHVRVNRNSYLTVDDPRQARDFAFDAFFFINLAELAMFLEDQVGISEDEFWAHVARVIRGYVASVPELAARCELFELCPSHIEVEKLTSRRLFPESDVQTHRVSCPW